MPLHKTDNSAMTDEEVHELQLRLRSLGFEPGPIDGIMGPHTESAIIAYKRSVGLRPRPYVGPITWDNLMAKQKELDTHKGPSWIVEARKALNRHEVYDNEWLKAWLRSDGHALGDPAQFPWCGDFVETPIRLTLPNEPIPKNPYWALNWLKFGVPCKPSYGCVAAIPRNGGGHVMYVVGEDSYRYYAMGGNQANKSSIVPVDKSRFTMSSFRWPMTTKLKPSNSLPRMTSSQAANTREG